ncbi:MAG TPA: type II restriction endonuclease [Pyrinomonadaceae bacterium]|jgi:hypothetical protein
MNLSDVFSDVAVKELTSVDIPRRGSNQHEINGTAPLRNFFKTNEKIKGPIKWHYFADDHEIAYEEGEFTFYDARLRSADITGRTEWRGYYTGDFLSVANPGDVLILAKTRDGELHGLLFEHGSNWLRCAALLLNLPELSIRYQVLSEAELTAAKVELTRQLILEELGVAVPVTYKLNDEDLMLATFGKTIPDTRTMARFARDQIEIDPRNADTALVRLLERETELFYALERVLVQEQLDAKFDSVDHFLAYSISIQQRRKARRGWSLQHHLEFIFTFNKLKFQSQAKTEAKSRPDFLFPGQREYHDVAFDDGLLVMLAAKSTAKERWRQVLAEADRIALKHLCTLEPAISVDQTSEMRRQSVQLVVPEVLFDTYAPKQREQLMTINNFIELVRRKQRN